VGQVGAQLLGGERAHVMLEGDALPQLAQRGLRELAQELRLPRQHDLEQLLAVGLEVREQAHLLDQLGVEILRLVDDQHGVEAGAQALDQEAVQRDHVVGLGLLARAEAELRREQLVEVDRGEACRVHHQRDLDVLGQAPDHRAQERGLAGAHLAREQQEALAAGDAVLEDRQTLLVGLGEPEEARVWREGEGGLLQAVEGLVHPRLAFPDYPDAATLGPRGRRRLRSSVSANFPQPGVGAPTRLAGS
jgi:hypothetical protein